MINWKVRVKNKFFWVSMIPMLLLLVSQVCGLFGIEIETEAISNQLIDIVATVFVLLGLLGIVNDPTTDGVTDSARAMTYEEPKKDIEIE